MQIDSHDRLVRRSENQQRQHLAVASSSQFAISITHQASEIREAQALRYRVFGMEGGAQLLAADSGLDIDRYDCHCDHLIARDVATSAVVGTYRILPPHVAMHMGFYSDSEFLTSELNHLKPAMCEFGRACVDHRYRSGAVIMQLWAGLAAYMLQNGYEHVLGVASVSLNDGGHNAASLNRVFSEDGSQSSCYRVTPRRGLDLALLDQHREVEMPALVRGYLRVGAMVCGAPGVRRGVQLRRLSHAAVARQHASTLRAPLRSAAAVAERVCRGATGLDQFHRQADLAPLKALLAQAEFSQRIVAQPFGISGNRIAAFRGA